jgi:hypothetical protein
VDFWLTQREECFAFFAAISPKCVARRGLALACKRTISNVWSGVAQMVLAYIEQEERNYMLISLLAEAAVGAAKKR